MMGWISAPSPAAVCTPNQKAGSAPLRVGASGTTIEAESFVIVPDSSAITYESQPELGSPACATAATVSTSEGRRDVGTS